MKASVIIPAYNAEATIGKCLESMRQQEFRDFEVIVVDDGSTDKTPELVKSFPEAMLLRQNHAGPAVARNNGAEKAKGEIIVFTDSDCVADKNWLGEMIRPFQDAGVAGVQGMYRSRQKELVARLIQLEIEQRYEKMLKQKAIDFMGTYSAAYRKSVFLEMKGFDTSFPIASGEDTDLSFRISKAGYKMVFNPKAIIFHTHPTSLKKYLKVKYYRAFWRTRVYKKHSAKMFKDSYTSQMVKAQVGLFYLMVFAFIAWLAGITIIFFAAFLVGIFVSSLPFALWAGKRDLTAGVISPFVILARTIVFSIGLLLGTIRQAFNR